MIALVDALKPDKFTGVYFKRKKKDMVWFIALEIH
jgi:hypothetical protein